MVQKFRKIAAFDQVVRGTGAIGGEGKIAEIDETCFVRSKYHEGRILAYQKWAIGGVERGNSQACFIEFVERRDRETLMEVILRRVASGSTIMTDEWGGYRDLAIIFPQYNYRHLTVNHSTNFVSPQTGANTQTVENLWSVTKRTIRKQGTHHGDLSALTLKIYESLFKRTYKQEAFNKMLSLISMLSSQ